MSPRGDTLRETQVEPTKARMCPGEIRGGTWALRIGLRCPEGFGTDSVDARSGLATLGREPPHTNGDEAIAWRPNIELNRQLPAFLFDERTNQASGDDEGTGRRDVYRRVR